MSNLRNLLQESHADLAQWFLLHQECLLIGNDASAISAFSLFASHLRQHIEFENRVVLATMQGVADTLRWKPDLYLREHDKIVKMLVRLELLLNSYCQLTGRKKRLALLEVLDNEQSFRHVMEHHEQREETDLFLQFVGVLPDSAAMEWLEAVRQWNVASGEKKCELKDMLGE